MNEAMISLLAPASMSPATLDEWVERQVERLRTRWRFTGVGIGRLTRSRPIEGGDWLIELDLHDRDVAPESDIAIAAILTNLEKLGLRPQLFVIAAPMHRPLVSSAARRDDHAGDRSVRARPGRDGSHSTSDRRGLASRAPRGRRRGGARRSHG